MWSITIVIVFFVSSGVDVSFARRSPNADLVVEQYLQGPETGRFSDNVLEDAMLDVPGLIRKYQYPIEVHNVTTEDGYILELHRIPYGRDQNNAPDSDKPAVLLLHGLLSSSADFVLTGPGSALAYILAEAGYDVWLGNARGNYYSRNHVTLDPDNPSTREDFWKFSWEEIGSYDIPAMIDFILETSQKSRLHFIGHSQGTTAFFVMGSLRPEYNEKIISMQAFAPVAYMEYNENPLFVALAPLSFAIETVGALIGFHEVFPRSEFITQLGRRLCVDDQLTQAVCSNLIFILTGGGPEFHNATILPVILGHGPAGASLRQIVHYGQHIRKNFFRRYDHGLFINWQLYWSFTPPSFDLSLITAPVYLHYADVDMYAHINDVNRLYEELVHAKLIRVPHENFNHVDFIWGTEAKSLLYDKTIEIMKSHE